MTLVNLVVIGVLLWLVNRYIPIHNVRAGRDGARNTKQIIAIGLSKARRAGTIRILPSGSQFSLLRWDARILHAACCDDQSNHDAF